MRTVTAALFASVDGVVESPNLFQFDHFDDDMGPLMDQALAGVDEVVMGRVTYDEWSNYWPQAPAGDFGDFINPITKYVASRTLTGALSWANAELVSGELDEFVRDLKAREGGSIAVVGSISIVRQLFLNGLIDTLTLMVHPVIAGAGRHLFAPEDATTRLRLVDHTMTTSGNAVLTYTLRP